jgi:hypothetical protein
MFKHLNFPPYDVIGIKLKSMISATNTAVRRLKLICIEREPQLSIYSIKKSFTLQPRDLCHLKKLGWGAKFALYENFSRFDCTKTIGFIRIVLHVMGTGRFDE